MKRCYLVVSMLACLLLCCLLCGCSTPITEPPADSLMIDSSFVMLEQRQVAYKAIYTVRYGRSAEYYKLQLENGVESVGTYTPERTVNYSELPYQHYAALLDTLVAHLQQDDLGMSDTQGGNFAFYYQRGGVGINQMIANKAPDAADETFCYIGYYVYSIGQKTLTPGDGKIMGEDRWGSLEVYSQNPFVLSPTFKKLEYCSILIAD